MGESRCSCTMHCRHAHSARHSWRHPTTCHTTCLWLAAFPHPKTRLTPTCAHACSRQASTSRSSSEPRPEQPALVGHKSTRSLCGLPRGLSQAQPTIVTQPAATHACKVTRTGPATSTCSNPAHACPPRHHHTHLLHSLNTTTRASRQHARSDSADSTHACTPQLQSNAHTWHPPRDTVCMRAKLGWCTADLVAAVTPSVMQAATAFVSILKLTGARIPGTQQQQHRQAALMDSQG